MVSGQKVPGHKVPKLVNIGHKVPDKMSNKMLISQLFFDITINYHLRLYNFKYALNKNENKCF